MNAAKSAIITMTRAVNGHRIEYMWSQFREAWALAELNRCELRHFVKTAGHRAGMDEVALSYLQGHAPEGMGGQYDHPEDDEDIFDRQRSALPNGALGLLRPPVVEVAPGVDREQLELLARYNAGGLSTRDLADGIEALRLQKFRAAAGSPLYLQK